VRIRFLTSLADIKGWSYDYGEVADVPDARAELFIANGQAERVHEVCPHCGGDLSPDVIPATSAPAGEARAALPRAGRR